MRVRVWISGAEGPSHDFELVDAPRVGERVIIGVGAETEEGIVTAVTWHLHAIDTPAADLSLVAEPLGAVTMVHVICRPVTPTAKLASAAADADISKIGAAR